MYAEVGIGVAIGVLGMSLYLQLIEVGIGVAIGVLGMSLLLLLLLLL